MDIKRIFKILLVTAVSLTFICSILPFSDAHILIIGDSTNDLPDTYNDTTNIAKLLKSNGYSVLELYKENATTKNILKGMYGADAIIYAGHGGFQTGNYNLKGGFASPPFALDEEFRKTILIIILFGVLEIPYAKDGTENYLQPL